MAAVDALIVVGFAAYALATGLRSRRAASRNLDEYFLAGRDLKGWHAGLSMAATQFAADTPLLVTGLIATAGIFSLWRLWIYAVAFLLLGFVLAAGWRRAGVLTDAELTELRYGGKSATVLRAVKAVYFGTVFNCTVLAMVLLATKEIAEPFLTWDLWLPGPVFESAQTLVTAVGVPLARETGSDDVWLRSTNNLLSIAALVAVTLAYSATGGLRSVVRTDIGQFAVMITATAVYAFFIVREAGGMSAIVAGLREAYPPDGSAGITATQILAFTPSHARDASLAIMAAFGLQWLVQMNADGTGYLAQRCMACRSDGEAKKAAVVFTFTQILLRSLLWLPIGLALLVVFPAGGALESASSVAAREATFVRGIEEVLPAGARGLMLTAMLAALASTIDTHLNWGASYWTNDLYKRFLCQAWLKREPSARSLVWVARASNVLILFIALGVMSKLSSIQSAWHVSLLLGSGMGVLLVVRWLWWRVTAVAELTAIAVSLLLAPLLLFVTPQMGEALRLLILAAAATGLGIAAAVAAGPERMDTLVAFYKKTRPPGVWGKVAIEAGADPAEDRRKLLRGLAAVVIAAASVFCLLTGAGSWLVQSPSPAWFPYRGPWCAGLVVLGLAAIPLWRRLA